MATKPSQYVIEDSFETNVLAYSILKKSFGIFKQPIHKQTNLFPGLSRVVNRQVSNFTCIFEKFQKREKSKLKFEQMSQQNYYSQIKLDYFKFAVDQQVYF